MSLSLRVVVLATCTLGSCGCGAGNAEPASVPATSTTATPDVPPAESTEASTPSATPEVQSTPVTSLPPVSNDYEITRQDCQALADNFKRVLRKQELAEIEAKKLKGQAYQRATEQAGEVAQQGADNWFAACQGIVGSVQPRGRLKCALKARTRQRFEGCMDGKFDAEP